MNRDRYVAATSRHEKVFVAQQVVIAVLQTGRFLKYDKNSGVWREVSEETARQKVCQALQYRRRRAIAAQEESNAIASTRPTPQRAAELQPSPRSEGFAVGDHRLSLQPMPLPLDTYAVAPDDSDDLELSESGL